MKFAFYPHDGVGNQGYVPPICDRDGKVMIPAQLVDPADPRATQTFTPGTPFDVNEQTDQAIAAVLQNQ